MDNQLNNKKIAILTTNGFEQVELTSPREALQSAGAQVHIVSPQSDRVQGWNHYDKADIFEVDVPLSQANAGNYDALLLPGGVANPDQLRVDQQAVQFIRAFADAGKPIAAICHGPWTLIEAGIVKGRQVTSYQSIKTDLQNAGAHWVDQEVVIDNNLITSRNPGDLSAFNRAIVDGFAAGRKRELQMA
ncbi:type 1 glutamine amidotransferase [Romeria aff. gracilis LEGE 07310]|uniref:Type 1 glutamine amidotransferase n=1 Tax=Vasconcelosia minhoensis LEGE 07310 TaxID=915328 RepID=A0A8J7AV14_9CYAN|nr:type 1 glutamine amidotransferase domain-containing protein [Romeria gracilis]MBE9077403.1 type 1 glutamine amidotransferase [Romeria aff. gracilis LEGE 07310]